MNSRGNVIRQAVSVWLSALMLVLSIAVPTLERAEFAHETAVESEHNPATCPPAHDHTVCTQVSANLSAASAPISIADAHATLRMVMPVDAPRSAGATFPEGHPSRAPPVA